METVQVGRKKKANPAVAPAKGFRPVGLRASVQWAEWLERLAKHCRTDVAKLIDAAVTDYAQARGFLEPPPERIP
jgi:hypothetical protein